MLSSFSSPSFLSILKADLLGFFVVHELSLPFVCNHYHSLHRVLGVTQELC